MTNVVSILQEVPAPDSLVTDWVETTSFRLYMKDKNSQPVLQQKWVSQSTLNEQWRPIQIVIGNENEYSEIPN